jgi:hypothetical protein
MTTAATTPGSITIPTAAICTDRRQARLTRKERSEIRRLARRLTAIRDHAPLRPGYVRFTRAQLGEGDDGRPRSGGDVPPHLLACRADARRLGLKNHRSQCHYSIDNSLQ